MGWSQRSRRGGYVLAGLLATVGIVLGIVLSHDPRQAVVSASLAPIAVAAYLGGRSAGLIATAMAVIAFGVMYPHEYVRVALVGVNGVVVSVLSHLLHLARRQAETLAVDQEAAHQPLARSRQQLEQMFAAMPVPAVLARLSDWRVVAANEAFVAWSHLDRDAIATPGVPDSLLDAEHLEALKRAALAGAVHELEVVATVNGERRTVLVSANPITVDGAPHVIGTLRDVTELRATQARFATAFRASPLASSLVRLSDQVYLDVNQRFLDLFGFDRVEVIGLHIGAVPILEHVPDHVMLRARMLAHGHLREQEVALRSKSGARLDGLWSVEIVEIDGERCMLSVIQDVTERNREAAALRATETKFAAAFRANPLPSSLVHGSDHRFLDVNDAYVQLLGYTREELIGRTVDELQLVSTDDRVGMTSAVLHDGRLLDHEVRLRTRAGDLVDALVSTEVISHGDDPQILTVIQDVTERKRKEAALHASEARFATAFRGNPQPSSIVRASDLLFLDVNDAYLRLFGLSRAEVVGASARRQHRFINDHERDAMLDEMRREGRIAGREVRLLTRGGQAIEALWSMEYVDVAGERCLLTVIQDVTERKRKEAELRASEVRFATAFLANPLASTILRLRDRTFLSVNEAFSRVFGYEPSELIGRASSGFEFYADPAEKGLAFDELRRRGFLREFPMRARRKDGSVLELLISSERIEIDGEPCAINVFQDVTERNHTEALLRESESRFRDLVDNIQDVFWVTTPEMDRIVYISRGYERVWGRTCESLVGDPRQWVEAIVENDRERVFSNAAMRETGEFKEEYRITRPDGSVRWILDRGVGVFDEAGHLRRRVGIARDITEIKALEDQLRQTQKMESLGMLAGGVAHDFNNVLAVIASCSGMLGDAILPGDENRELVDEIDGAVQRASALTRQLLAFSRKQVAEPKIVDVNTAVNETRKMLRRMVGEDVLLSTSLHPELGAVRIDPGNLVQVLMNLAVNARDAMPRGGTLSLVTREVVLTDDDVMLHRDVRPGRAVMLEVTDTGHGMTPEVQARIFEPFFTTKHVGRGTGMGLAVVHGIIEQAGGFISVESTPGVGSVFRIYLPVVGGSAVPVEQLSSALAMGSETILIVDDDEHVRRVGARALRARGYQVVEASDGPSALAHLASRIKFDLLLTDVVMPGMDGRQLVETARSRLPTLRVLYTSGYTDDAVVRHGVMRGEFDLLEKPFRLDTLASKVRHVLDQ